MNVLSLFSGIGGFDLGFERAGMNVVGVCEIDKHAQKILQRHFPAATLHTDVRKVSYERGTIDVICGGFPCQDISVAGKRAGLAGERSGLWFEFARIIDETQPAWVVIENVPGLFSSARGEDFAEIIQWLDGRGYGVAWRVLDAQGFGLAQRRKRVFIVASFGSPRCAKVLFESESGERHHQPSRTKGKADSGATADETAQDIVWECDHTDIPARICKDQECAPTLKSRMGTGGNNIPLVGVRRLTPTECERLQGFPDVQKSCIIQIWENCTDQQKNFVIAEILNHKLQKRVLNAESHELTQSVLSAIQHTLQENQNNSKHAVVNVLINFEQSVLEIRNHEKLFLSVPIATKQSWCHLPINIDDFVRAVVLITTIAGNDIHNGRVGLHQNMTHSTIHENGKNVVVLSGHEIMRAASDVDVNMIVIKNPIMSTTYEAEASFQSFAQTLTILSCYVSHAISLCIPEITFPMSSLSLNLMTKGGWTSGQADSHRYKQLGNAVAVPVAEWIGKRMKEVHNDSTI